MTSEQDNTILPVSVCMLVLNEEDRLPRTLPSASAFAEWIVLDSGSTDRSVELCEDAGVTVHKTEWEGFGPTRIRLFQKATQPWILWLDSDEVITDELLSELRNLFKNGPDAAAYEINRMVCLEGKWIRHGDWFPDWNIRLFKSDAWSMQPRAVHESLEIRGSVSKLNALLEHHSFRNWDDLKARSEKYANLWAEEHKDRKKPGPFSASLHAAYRFFKGYCLKLGFLDGITGFKIANANASEVALKYRLLRERQ